MTATGLTLEEFEQLPDVLTHNRELVNGELVDVPGNAGGHNKMRDGMMAMLYTHVHQHKLGLIVAEQEFAFGEDAHGPDISFLRPSKTGLFDNRLRVFSIPNRQAFLYSERGNGILFEDQDFQSPLIPGFSIKIADLFAMI